MGNSDGKISGVLFLGFMILTVLTFCTIIGYSTATVIMFFFDEPIDPTNALIEMSRAYESVLSAENNCAGNLQICREALSTVILACK